MVVTVIARQVWRSELDDGKQGLLTEPKDEKALADALIRILRDPVLQRTMGEEGRIKARNYAWREVAKKVLDYYRELLERRRWPRPVQERS